ncbi:hypothetical protein A0H81_01616 [Grifola frondosa]|uniref:Uncharacterized protein n=1 Tax=Grifola frondosa TaxID=5627 RepID=A0A1C7MM04_GRIFR|nr:hypothetical protein A0H81_01616 [Grifola frondosa]
MKKAQRRQAPTWRAEKLAPTDGADEGDTVLLSSAHDRKQPLLVFHRAILCPPLLPSTMSPPTLRLSLQVIPVRRRLKHPFRSLLKKIRATLNIKTRNTSEPFKLPYLPSELWGVIIQHACLLYHDPLDTSQELSFLDSSSAQLATYRASMTLKKNLSLVSHEWNDYARRYLYEFVWISRAVQAKALARTLLLEYIDDTRSSGKYIRRLHIETSVLERCAPADLRTILEYAPHLNIYSDHRSVQRSLYDNMPDPRCSPEEILKLVIRPKIRRLSWTTYDDVPFQLRMTPLLQNLTIGLEYLELSSVSSSFRPSLSNSLSQAPDIDALQMSAQLPSLRALKLSLDNSTFAVLASWDMPP